jgi:hypothetical protein
MSPPLVVFMHENNAVPIDAPHVTRTISVAERLNRFAVAKLLVTAVQVNPGHSWDQSSDMNAATRASSTETT